jgi:hypothetical protein
VGRSRWSAVVGTRRDVAVTARRGEAEHGVAARRGEVDPDPPPPSALAAAAERTAGGGARRRAWGGSHGGRCWARLRPRHGGGCGLLGAGAGKEGSRRGDAFGFCVAVGEG